MGAEIVGHFQIEGTVVKVEPLGNGLINDTYKVTTAEADKPDYVLQRINHAIFQDVDLLQHNIEVDTAHIWRRAAPQTSIAKCCASSPQRVARPTISMVPATGA